MPICVAEQDSRRLAFPVVVGGAAINRDFGRRIAFLYEGSRYLEPGVFYAKDAFEGLDIMDALTGDRRDDFVREIQVAAEKSRDAAKAAPARPKAGDKTGRDHLSRVDPPRAPFFGVRTIAHVPPAELWTHFDLRSLYRLSWGAANLKGAEWDRIVREEFEPRLRGYEALAEREPMISPRVVYGYFPAAGLGDDVIVYDPADATREVGRFRFSRQIGGEYLCLADYLREPENGAASDVIALQVVTVGREVSQRIDALQHAGDYSESYYLHGFSVQSAEALAEHTHSTYTWDRKRKIPIYVTSGVPTWQVNVNARQVEHYPSPESLEEPLVFVEGDTFQVLGARIAVTDLFLPVEENPNA